MSKNRRERKRSRKKAFPYGKHFLILDIIYGTPETIS
jgi:hypothetical protein